MYGRRVINRVRDGVEQGGFSEGKRACRSDICTEVCRREIFGEKEYLAFMYLEKKKPMI